MKTCEITSSRTRDRALRTIVRSGHITGPAKEGIMPIHHGRFKACVVLMGQLSVAACDSNG